MQAALLPVFSVEYAGALVGKLRGSIAEARHRPAARLQRRLEPLQLPKLSLSAVSKEGYRPLQALQQHKDSFTGLWK